MITNLDVVLPCYNPLLDWNQRVFQSFRQLQTLLPDTQLHLIIVNDGSSKNLNEEQIAWLKAQIPTLRWVTYAQNQGKGYALRQGVAAAQHDFCIYTDIDFPYEAESFLKIYQQLQSGADLSVGVREENYYDRVPTARIWISKFLKWLIRYFLKLPISDTQCGLKGFNGNGREVFLRTTINRYLFDLEFIFLAARGRKLHIVPVVVQLRSGIVFSSMNFKILFQEGRSFLKIFLRSLLHFK